ncbi:hypothetical protein TRIATDRAFT_315190, partial [Trichoderma atroviride IMI 206040]
MTLAIWGEESFDGRGLNLRREHPLLAWLERARSRAPSTSLRLSGYPAKCTSMLIAERFAHNIYSPKRRSSFHIDSLSSSIFRWTS